MNNSNQSTFSADPQNLKICFQVYANPQQNQANIREAEAYLAQCKQDKEFPSLLLKIFEDQTEDKNIRLLSFIQFKNLIKEPWRVKRLLKQTISYSEEFKMQVRSFLVKCLDVYQDKLFRKQIDDALRIICFSDFPVHYQELVEYFLKSIENLNAALEDQNALMGTATVNALKTLKNIINERSPKRFGDTEAIFTAVYFRFIQNFHKFWDYFHTNLQTAIESSTTSRNLDQIKHFLKLARMADSIYIGFLCNGCDEMIGNEAVLQAAGLIIQRTLQLVKIVQVLSSRPELEDICEMVSKNLYKLIFEVSQLQVAFPLLFKDVLTDYLQLMEYIITNADDFKSEYILRATVIALTSVVKCYLYYSNDIYLLQKRKMEKFGDYQKDAFTKFHAHFTGEKIETFFQLFLVKLLPKRNFLSGMENDENFQDLVEIDDEQAIDDNEKLENSLYKLTLACTMAFLLQLSEFSIPIIHTFCIKVVTNEVQMPSSAIQDGLFSIIGLLPIVYRKKNIDPPNYLNFEAVLKYLEHQARVDINLARRIPVLIHKWLDLFSLEIKANVIKLIVEITKSLESYLIRYECCMCLKAAFESDVKMGLDYASITEQLVPVVVDILHKSLNPQVVWSLIGLLKVLFIKAQYTSQNLNLVNQIQELGIGKLIKVDYEPLENALADMLKSIIASFPAGTEIPSMYQLCLEFIDYQLGRGRVKFFTLSLWLFVAKEYTPAQGIEQRMKEMFGKYSSSLLNLNSPYDISMFINIIEEYLLAELLTADEYPNVLKIIEDFYSKTIDVSKPTEEVFEVKSSILSLLSTLLLTMLETKSAGNVAIFENVIVFLLKDLFSNYEALPCRAFRVFKAASLSLINRFIILFLNGIFEIFQKYQIDFNEFVRYWVKNMNNLSSKPAMRINTLAILHVVPYIQNRELLLNSIGTFLKHTIPEVEEYIETGGQAPNIGQNYITGTSERLRDVRDSERKKASRQAQLYFDANLGDTFVSVFKDAVSKHNLDYQEILNHFNDELTLGRFMKLIGA